MNGKPPSPKRNSQSSVQYKTDIERYTAIGECDQSADGKFFYAVKTTGIFCRPSCKSRLPKRDNVQFFLTCEAAERAGFRPCKRCAPDELPLEKQLIKKMAAVCRLIEASESAPSLEFLAKASGLSQYHFHRIFKKVIGMTPKAFHRTLRANTLRELLQESSSVLEAIYESGYQSTGRFYADSPEILGMTPKNYRENGSKELICFSVGECSLGSVLVASTGNGVCAILLGDDPNELAVDLQNRFSKATILSGDKAYEKVVASVIGIIDSSIPVNEELPLDIRGTVFQQRVWKALREIPTGESASYREIAEKIGAPKSARAVAGACAANPLAIVIPCHRVVRMDGSPSGYRWGVERKHSLLKRESKS
ncbi:UNVERIFIED_CONTAM: hypothetical protein GTU68_059773 [Idotea baltica]|nr:hypothetical protein [Idotea baltica]